MTKSESDQIHRELVDNVLNSFYSTYSKSSRPRSETDVDFQVALRNAALASMSIIALACMEGDETFQNMAPRLIGNPKNDSDEVAELRVFALDNFVTDGVHEINGAVERLNWLREIYIHSRGGTVRHIQNFH